MQLHPLRGWIVLLCLFCAVMVPAWAQPRNFYLHDGDTVVFYGDSITEQGFYTADVDLYARTRFPRMKLHFYSAGIGGDRVSGGFAGGIDERLQRDVFPHKPTVVTVMLGMNDAGYKALTDDTLVTYTKGYEHILQSVHQAFPQARLTLLGTSPYDEVTRPALVPGGYNNALVKLTAVNQQLAQKYNALYIDLNAPVIEALTLANADNPLATEMMIPDRIHPGLVLHWIMAAAILKGWGAPATVTSLEVDAAALHPTGTQDAAISNLERAGTGLKWQELESALPLPLDSKVADVAFMLKHSDVEQSLNQEPMKITGLAPGNYRLTIDGTEVGTASSRQWQEGVNLGEWKTPMRDQAQSVVYLIRDYEVTQLVHTRLLVRDHDHQLPSSGGDEELNKFQDLEDGMIVTAAAPKAHAFQLSPAQ